MRGAKAQVLTGASPGGGTGHSFANTLLQVTGERFLADPHSLQTEAFGNVSLAVVADSVEQAGEVLAQLEAEVAALALEAEADLFDSRPRVGEDRTRSMSPY